MYSFTFGLILLLVLLIIGSSHQTPLASGSHEDSMIATSNESVLEIQARLSNYNPDFNRGCGELPMEIKIVGGQASYNWPWMAALRTMKKNRDGVKGPYKCGGILVTDLHVLTAAHCVVDAVEVQIQLGHHRYFKVDEGEESSQLRLAEKVFVHEGYRPITLQNDIALIKLDKRVPLDDNIWPICLPPGNVLLDGQVAHVSGWGKKRSSDLYGNENLLEVQVPIWADEVCRKLEEPHPFNGERQICAGPREGGKGFCQGDSGGGLMHQSAPNLWSVVGIVSSAYGCAAINRPGIYTRVSFYTDWIVTKMFLL